MDNKFNKLLLKTAIKEALFEAGLAKDMVNMSQASKILSRRLVENGIKSEKLRVIDGEKKNSHRLIPLRDLVKYKRWLLNNGKIKINDKSDR